MSGSRAGVLRRLRRPGVWIDAMTYAVALGSLAVGTSYVVGISTGGGFARGNLLLFILGWVAIAYASFRMWPSGPPHEDESGTSLPATQRETAFQAFVARLPPNRWIAEPPPTRRMTMAGKLFLAGVVMLVASYFLESIGGIG